MTSLIQRRRVDERTSRHRLNPWLAAWLGLNTVLSLTAIGLWVTTSREVAAGSHKEDTARLVIPSPAVAPLPGTTTARPHLPFAPPPLTPISGSGIEPISPTAAFVPSSVRNVQAPTSAALTALAERTRIRPEAFAELVDAKGEISKAIAMRLERGVEAAEAAAKRLRLDEVQTQSFVAVVTDGVFSVLREELSGASGQDFEEMTQPILDDVRLLCGEQAAKEAEALLARI